MHTDFFEKEQGDVLKALDMICPAMRDDKLPLFVDLLKSGEVKQRSRVMQVAAELGMQFVSKSRKSLDTLAQALLSGVDEECKFADLMKGGSLLAALLRDESDSKHESLRESSKVFVYLMESLGPAALRHRSAKRIAAPKRVVDLLVEFEKVHAGDTMKNESLPEVEEAQENNEGEPGRRAKTLCFSGGRSVFPDYTDFLDYTDGSRAYSPPGTLSYPRAETIPYAAAGTLVFEVCVCVCVCVCICMYICVYIYIYICVYIYVIISIAIAGQDTEEKAASPAGTLHYETLAYDSSSVCALKLLAYTTLHQ
jgi:hypothetical protein